MIRSGRIVDAVKSIVAIQCLLLAGPETVWLLRRSGRTSEPDRRSTGSRALVGVERATLEEGVLFWRCLEMSQRFTHHALTRVLVLATACFAARMRDRPSRPPSTARGPTAWQAPTPP